MTFGRCLSARALALRAELVFPISALSGFDR
jgi:hypothetical protein